MRDAPPRLEVIDGLSTVSEADLENLEDDDLMLRARLGQTEAFAVLVSRHQQLVVGFVARYWGVADLAADIAQEVFLTAWKTRHRYQPEGSFRGYLLGIAKNHSRQMRRKRRRNYEGLRCLADRPSEVSADCVLLDGLIRAQRAIIVQKVIPKLPPNVRQVLILRYTFHLSLSEIGDVLDIPVNTVKSHIVRGMRRLAKLVKEEMP